MKNHLLLKIGVSFFLLMILTIPFNANSQFLNPDANWIVHNFGGGGEFGESYDNIRILNDSTINNISYSIFEYEYFHINLALREDSSKVFFRVVKDYYPDPYSDTLEHVLYDFNLNLGDSILLEFPRDDYFTKRYWTVFEMDSVRVGSEHKKKFRLILKTVSPGTYMPLYWIEDIGSSYGPLYIAKSLTGEEYSTE